MGFFVPETLKNCNQWIVQREKVPYSPKTGHKCSVIDPAHWASYGEALERLEIGDFDGLGFVFTAQDDLVFIDLDNCLDEDGDPNEFAKEILSLIPETYTETSRSETGLHIVCRGRIPKAIKRKEIEIYSSGRYMAFTGNATSTTEPRKAQKALNTLFNRYKPTEPRQNAQQSVCVDTDSNIDEIIQRIEQSKQGERFKLLHAGRWEEARNSNGKPYSSQSEADLAYMNIVHFFASGNTEAVKAIFAISGLADREKGRRGDYIERTLVKVGINNTGEEWRRKAVRQHITDYEPPKRKRRGR